MKQLKQMGFLIAGLLTGFFLAFSLHDLSVTEAQSYIQLSQRDILNIIARPLETENTAPGYYLVGAQMSNLLLENAILRNANMRAADLSNSNLENALLRGADLSRAKLNSSQLRFADLSATNLLGANLTSANLFQARLIGANLDSAILTGVDFTDAVLEGAILPDGSTYQFGDDLVNRFNAASNP
jgi:uncharacterized protein YjbI with pentapeptide repeats